MKILFYHEYFYHEYLFLGLEKKKIDENYNNNLEILLSFGLPSVAE